MLKARRRRKLAVGGELTAATGDLSGDPVVEWR
jgi:hypothetical protein